MIDLVKIKSSQSGYVLPVGMVMMLILSLIGVATMRDGILQEKMSSNYLDKEKSFQAAESALRTVQRITLRNSVEFIEESAGFNSNVENPGDIKDFDEIDLTAVGFIVPGIRHNDHDTFGFLNDNPTAFIEELSSTQSLKIGKDPENKELAQRFYRITAVATGETETATTALQGVAVR